MKHPHKHQPRSTQKPLSYGHHASFHALNFFTQEAQRRKKITQEKLAEKRALEEKIAEHIRRNNMGL
jgi:hypothetical protein